MRQVPLEATDVLAQQPVVQVGAARNHAMAAAAAMGGKRQCAEPALQVQCAQWVAAALATRLMLLAPRAARASTE